MKRKTSKVVYKDKRIGFRVPEHFYNAIEQRANEFGLTVSAYINFCLIYDMRKDVLSKEIKNAETSGSIAFMVYPSYNREAHK